MSGDVQPRKRKDKRRKKEGGSLGSIQEPIIPHKFKKSESDDRKIFDVPDQGEKIHVQNEHGIGGNFCVKIIFFCLFGLLVGAVGLIYMKSLGSTDVDLPTIEESRFAEYFTGWLDDSPDDHEHEALENNVDNDLFEHDEHDEHDDHDEHNDNDQEDHDDEEHIPSSVQDSIYKLFGLQSDEPDEIEESDVKADKVSESEESGIRQDVDEDEENSEEENEKDVIEEEEVDKDADEKDEVKKGEENDEEYGEEEEDEEENNDSGFDMDEQDESEKDEEDENNLFQADEEDEDDLSQVDEEDEEEYGSSELNEENEKKDKSEIKEENYEYSDNDSNNKEEDEEETGEVNQEIEEDEEKESKEKERNFKIDDDELGYEEIDISEDDLEENEHKLTANQEAEEETEEQSTEETVGEAKDKLTLYLDIEEEKEEEAEYGGVALKLGVGIALIIVAHLVLVKKWKSMSNSSSDENASTEIEAAQAKKEIKNLHSSVEPVISRRQTLVLENVCSDNSYEEEIEDEEEYNEGEENVEEEEYSEKLKKSSSWETFEKPTWNIKRNENRDNAENVDNEKFEDGDKEEYEEEDEQEDRGEEEEEEKEEEEEEEEEVEEEEEEEDEEEEEEDEEEEEEDEEEEDYEDDDELEDEHDFVKQKSPIIHNEERQEEAKDVTPAPPPRTKSGRGGREVDEDFEELTEVEESSQSGSKVVETIKLEPEEQETPKKKVGNEDEWAFRQELDFADEQLENNPRAAVEAYVKIISKKPTMIRALIGRARALDHWAEKEKSNAYLKQAINAYKTLLLNHGHLLDDETFVKLAERCIERMRFAGALISAVDIHKALISKYPNTPKFRNALAVTYLMLNKIPQARVLLNETLSLWPEDGFALVHYGFILKTSDNNMEEGAKKLMAGIQTKQEGVIDGMFFFHLGDALNRLGREKEAMKWYELGVKEGLFLSKYQRSLYNVDRLKGQPWWTKEETTYQDFFKKLEDNWKEIRREGLELLNSKGVNLFKEEAENLKDTGDWKQLDLYFRGRKQPSCNKAPITCSLVSSFKSASTCTRGQIKFSVMLPNTHVWPHCGPTNCRLRSHLGLVVPPKTFIRVAEETRSWKEGKFIIFDDSFEHEVWHNGTGLRLVLIVDVWHPELTNHERRSLSPI